jgi:hypothetical protein
MARASVALCVPDDRGEGCPPGHRCWGQAWGPQLCWPDATESCVGARDGDGSCVPTPATYCDPSCGSFCQLQGSDRSCGEIRNCLLLWFGTSFAFEVCMRSSRLEEQALFAELYRCLDAHCHDALGGFDWHAVVACGTLPCEIPLRACD